VEQAERIASLLKDQRIAAIYSSPMKRALDTAQAICQACRLEVNLAPELKEIDAGELEGVYADKMERHQAIFWAEWLRGNACIPLPGGESLEELQRRVWRGIVPITTNHPQETVVVVSHQFVNLAIICRAMGMDLHYVTHLRLDPGAVSILEISPQGNSLVLFNDTCHLGTD